MTAFISFPPCNPEIVVIACYIYTAIRHLILQLWSKLKSSPMLFPVCSWRAYNLVILQFAASLLGGHLSEFLMLIPPPRQFSPRSTSVLLQGLRAQGSVCWSLVLLCRAILVVGQ